MTLIELSDEHAAALKAKAAAEGLSLEAWMGKLAGSAATPELSEERPMEVVAEIVLSCMRSVPLEEMAKMPSDGASQHDHYIYGWPKKEL
jgi:hypothetical protein